MADLVALGELLIDFTPVGASEEGLPLIQQNPGGAPANCLAAAAGLGLDTAFIGKVGADIHGRFLRAELEKAGVSCQGLREDAAQHTTLAFVSLGQDGEREFAFLRNPGADTCLKAEELDMQLIRGAKALHVGSLSLTDEPARTATWKAVIAAKSAGAVVSYDPNYRAMLWPDVEAAKDQMRSLLPVADIVKLSDEEIGLVAEAAEPEQAIENLRTEGPSVILITLGSRGAMVANREEIRHVPGFSVQAVDATGAGDAFMGGFMAALIKSGLDIKQADIDALAEFARVGCAAAALCVSRRGGIPAMPALEEAEALLAR